MKYYFLAGFIAAVLCSIFWAGVIILAISNHRLWGMGVRAIVVVAPLPFFLWAAREMHGAFRNKGE